MSEGKEAAAPEMEATQDVEIESSVEKAGGESVSFDELEAIEAATEREKKATIEERIEEEKAVKAATEDKDEKDEDDAKKADAEKDSKETETKTTETVLKAIKAKLNDDEVEIALEAKVPVKIDGEETEVTVEQLMKNYSGEQAVQKRFAEFSQQKQQFVKERDQINTAIQELGALAKTDIKAAVSNLAEMLGADGQKVLDDLNAEVSEHIEKMAAMDPHERELYEARVQAENARKQLELREQRDIANRQEAETRQKISDLQKTHNIDDETFDTVAEELLQYKKEGRLQQDVTPELIAQVIINDRHYSDADRILQDVMPEKASDLKTKDLVVSVIRENPDLEIEDYKEIVREAFNVKSPEAALSKKVEKSLSNSTSEESPQVRHPQNEDVWSFEQML